MVRRSITRRTYSTSPLHDLCLSNLIENIDHYSAESLTQLPPVQRKQLLLLCPVVSICQLEQTCAFDGIDSDSFWDDILVFHKKGIGCYRSYDINATDALNAPHTSNREKYFSFLTTMIFSGDRFSGIYGQFVNYTGTARDYYEGATPPPEEQSCPDDIINYLVAYQKPSVVQVIEEVVNIEEPVSEVTTSDNDESPDDEDRSGCSEDSDVNFFYPLPSRDVFGTQQHKLYEEATKGQYVHSHYAHYILKENHYRLSDEDAIALMMNECHYYPRKLFLHEYERMHFRWSHSDLTALLTQFFAKLESFSLRFREAKDLDEYLPIGNQSKEILTVVMNCCFSSPVLTSLIIFDPVLDNTASLALSSTIATKPCPSLKVLDVHCWVRYRGEIHCLEALADIVFSHDQLTEISVNLGDSATIAASSLSRFYTSLIDFVQRPEFSKLTLKGQVPMASQLRHLVDTFLKTPCSQPQHLHLHSIEPVRKKSNPILLAAGVNSLVHVPTFSGAFEHESLSVNESTPTVHLQVGDYKVPTGALEYKSLTIDEHSKITEDFCEWLFSHQPFAVKSFNFDATIVSIAEYGRVVPSESVFPVQLLSDNTSIQLRELSLPIFDRLSNAALHSFLYHQELTKLSLRPMLRFKSCDINAITDILSHQKECLTELSISEKYHEYNSIDSTADMERFANALFSLRNFETFSLRISITWGKEDTSYIDKLYNCWQKHGCKKMKSFHMGTFEYGFSPTDELSRKMDEMGLVITTLQPLKYYPAGFTGVTCSLNLLGQ